MNSTGNQNERKDDKKLHASSSTTRKLVSEKKVCIACQRKLDGGKPYKHGHAPFCSKSIYHGMTEDEIAATKAVRSQKLKEKASVIRKAVGKEKELNFPNSTTNEHLVGGIPVDFSPQFLRDLVAANHSSNTAKAPHGILVILRYLQAIAPVFKRATNDPIRHEDNTKRLEIYKNLFPKGSLSFKIPKLDPTHPPDPQYTICAGCTICIARWELHEAKRLKCTSCHKGDLVYKKTQINQQSVKPVVDLDGKLTWCFLPSYRCSECETIVFANDPELLRKLPDWMQSAYPSEYNWVNKGKPIQYGRALSRLIETVMTAERGVDCHFVAYHVLRHYQLTFRQDHDGLIESCFLSGTDEPPTGSWTLERWLGDFDLPNGQSIRNDYEAAMAGGDWKADKSSPKDQQLTQHTITETTKPAKLDPISAESKSKRRRKNGSISEYPPSHGKNFPQTQPQVQPIPQFHQHPHWHIPPALPTHTVHPSRPSYSAHYPPHRSSYYPPFGGVSHDAHHAGYYPANPPSGFPNGSSSNTGTAPQREQSLTIDGTRGNNKRVVKKP